MKSPGLVPPVVIAVMVSGALPLFVSVTDWDALVVFSIWLPNGMLLALRVTAGAGATPVPLRPIDCGLPVALSVIETVAVRLPLAAGVKVALMLQVPLAASVAGLIGQVLVDEKSLGLVPPSVIALMVSGALPLLVRVTDFVPLVVPTV